ncbi:hypothetical protein [Novipirellula maiorica]|uniref:hypothetical protein n=1 Tax=Novipirellula maiorica TaxID=1265734 RepID=UPI0011818615|nr:hypothetical protein [Rhodopirellula maiorica]
MTDSVSQDENTDTFKQRVTKFWQWYPTVAERFFQTIEAGKCGDLVDEVAEFCEATIPGLSWVFGPGENGGHSFTLSGEGQITKQLLAEYWLQRAPEIPKWNFHASRQATPAEFVKGFAIAVDEGKRVNVDGFQIRTHVDDERQKIDIIAWHPVLESVPKSQHFTILFLLVDEVLGEFGTQMWLGEIKIEPFTPDAYTRSLSELPEFISGVNTYHQWEKLPPLDTYTVYQLKETKSTPRGDTVVGSSLIPRLVSECIDNNGKLSENPLANTGAELIYIAIDSSIFPEGQQSDVRANIEDILTDSLAKELSGQTLGGAFGLHESYVDLLLVDGKESRRIVSETLTLLQLDNRARIESFVD